MLLSSLLAYLIKQKTIKKPKSKLPTSIKRVAVAKEKKDNPSPLRKVGMWTDEDGNLRRPDGSYFWKNTEKPTRIDLTSRYPEQSAFKHISEIALAHILQINPGEPIENWVAYGEKFNEDFKLAMLNKIEIFSEDSEAVKNLKLGVMDLKDELAQRVRRGENPAKILNETRSELQRMGEACKQIEEDAIEAIKGSELTDDDLRKFSDRVNLLLEKEGLPPITNPKIFYIKLKYNSRKAGGNHE